MNAHDASALLSTAIPAHAGAGTWADLGAGDGTFTRALATLLGPGSRIYAVDRDANALATLDRVALPRGVTIIPVIADFTSDFALPNPSDTMLDGILLANSMHFVRDADAVLQRLTTMLKPGGSIVFVEYDRRAASQWVPYPIPRAKLRALAHAAGLSAPEFTATRPSAFGGDLYVARSVWPAT